MTTEILEVDCPYCAEKVSAKAKKCKHCSEILDATMRELEYLKSQKKDVYISNNAASSASSVSTAPISLRGRKSKGAAFLWALLLGAFGAHKFYLGQFGLGLLYFCFCWTGITAFIGLAEAIYFFFMDPADFDRKYNS